MLTTTPIASVARVVRLASLALAASMLVGFVSVQAFVAGYGTPVRTMVVEAGADDVLDAAVTSQEAAGLRCSEEPTLTDVVIFQRSADGTVDVLTFAEALEAAGAREGFIRRYCV